MSERNEIVIFEKPTGTCSFCPKPSTHYLYNYNVMEEYCASHLADDKICRAYRAKDAIKEGRQSSIVGFF